jgi:hypothetical membrane protein
VQPLRQHLAASKGAARLIAGRGPVPAWAVAAAALSQLLLVGGWLIAGELQPGSYSPMQQTMSELAGQTATDPWVMTAALFGVGSCQLATGLGLTRVRVQARLVLMLAGLSTIGVAASPDAAAGPTPWHLAFAVSCIVTTLVWPLFAVGPGPVPRVMSLRCALAVTAMFAALSCWLLICTQGSGDLGLAERLTCSVQGLWPFVVALALRLSEADSPIRPGGDPVWEADTDLGGQLAHSACKFCEFLRGVPEQLVAICAVHHEPGVLVSCICGRQRRDRIGYLGGSDWIVNMPRGHIADRDRPGYLNEPRLIEPGIVRDLRGGHLHGENDAAPRRARVRMQQPQRCPGRVHQRHVLQFLHVTTGVPLPHCRRDAVTGQRTRADLAGAQQSSQCRQRRWQINAHVIIPQGEVDMTRV